MATATTTRTSAFPTPSLPVYWIVNLPESQIEVYTQPRRGQSPACRLRHDYKVPRSVPLLLGGVEVGPVAVRDLLL